MKKNIFIFLFVIIYACQQGDVTDYVTYLNHNDTVKYVGQEQCKMCHIDIYNSYIKTGMGQSLNYATREYSALSSSNMPIIYDSIKNFSYKPFWKDDSLYLLEFRLKGKDTIHKFLQKVTYKIGSGQHTNSHLFNINGYIHQIPYTYYTQDSLADLPPGFEKGNNSRFTREIGLECMTCHNGHVMHNSESVNKYDNISLGIDCEKCHGPGELHVQQKLSGNIIDTSKYIDYSIVNPGKLPLDLQFDVCQRCHLQGTAVLVEGKSFTDFKPGMHLTDIMDIYLPKYDDNKFIMASHVSRLKESVCFKSSSITCVTCHNPHKSVTNLDITYFDNKCMTCHDLCSDEQTQNCTSCHMPKSSSTDIMHVSITDHKISIPSFNNNQENRGVFLGLQAINNINPTNLSKAKAYLKQYESFENNPVYLDSAIFFLENSQNSFTSFIQYYYLKSDDQGLINFVMSNKLDTTKYKKNNIAMCYNRIAEVFSRNDMRIIAKDYFKRSIYLMPLVIEYQLKYATFLIENKETELAASILKKAVSLNPIKKELHLNLGYIDILDKRYISAERRLYQALAIDPDYLLAYENLIILSRIQQKDEQVKVYLDKILEIAPSHKIKNLEILIE